MLELPDGVMMACYCSGQLLTLEEIIDLDAAGRESCSYLVRLDDECWAYDSVVCAMLQYYGFLRAYFDLIKKPR